MSTPTAKEIYANSVKDLPLTEQFRLAALILEELAKADAILVEQRDEWSEEDVRDLVAYSASYGASVYPEEDDIA